MFTEFHLATNKNYQREVDIYLNYRNIFDNLLEINRMYDYNNSRIRISTKRCIKRQCKALDEIVWC